MGIRLRVGEAVVRHHRAQRHQVGLGEQLPGQCWLVSIRIDPRSSNPLAGTLGWPASGPLRLAVHRKRLIAIKSRCGVEAAARRRLVRSPGLPRSSPPIRSAWPLKNLLAAICPPGQSYGYAPAATRLSSARPAPTCKTGRWASMAMASLPGGGEVHAANHCCNRNTDQRPAVHGQNPSPDWFVTRPS
jgi:hypothetical protein